MDGSEQLRQASLDVRPADPSFLAEFTKTMDDYRRTQTLEAHAAATLEGVRVPAGMSARDAAKYQEFRQINRGIDLARAEVSAERLAAIDRDPVAAYERLVDRIPKTAEEFKAVELEKVAALGAAIRAGEGYAKLTSEKYQSAHFATLAAADRLDRERTPERQREGTRERDRGMGL